MEALKQKLPQNKIVFLFVCLLYSGYSFIIFIANLFFWIEIISKRWAFVTAGVASDATAAVASYATAGVASDTTAGICIWQNCCMVLLAPLSKIFI